MDNIKTNEEALTAVKHDGLALLDTPITLKTHEVCVEAVTQNYYARWYVPKELKAAVILAAA